MFNKDTFDTFVDNLLTTNRVWEYFTDYQQVSKRISLFSELINYIGKVDKETFVLKFLELTSKKPEMIKATPFFTAIVYSEVVIVNEGKELKFDFNNITNLECISFLENVGFFHIFNNGEIDIPSYFLGVGIGLDSNSRKNRGGKLMEKYVCDKFIESKWDVSNNWMSQVKSTKIQELFGVDFKKELSLRKDKQFDFVLVTEKHIYLIETNFFNSKGSKINSMLARFKGLGNNVNNYFSSSTHEIHFVWITDGEKLKTDYAGFHDAFDSIECVMNIKNLENGSLDLLD